MLHKVKRIDWSIILILLAFLVISTMLIYSATMDTKYAGFHKNNVVYYGLGFACLFVVSMLDYRWIVKTSVYSYIIGILLLIGVFSPLGKVYFGARGWYEIPVINMSFQPAELMKLLLIITIAAYMARRNGEKLELLRDVIPIGLLTAVPFGLILIQPDLGNAIILIVILLGLYWIGNIKLLHVLLGTAIVAGAVAGFIYVFTTYHQPITDAMSKAGVGHWADRFDTFLDISNDNESAQERKDKDRQAKNSQIAIGSGNMLGDGFTQGTSIHANFIPVAYSDSIFVVVGEEFGFVGAAVLLVLYIIMIYRMIIISMETTDLAGSYIIVGIVTLYVFQIFENIGMLIGLMPLTGITLPFISYGGTSLLINMLAIGLIMSIRTHQEKPLDYA